MLTQLVTLRGLMGVVVMHILILTDILNLLAAMLLHPHLRVSMVRDGDVLRLAIALTHGVELTMAVQLMICTACSPLLPTSITRTEKNPMTFNLGIPGGL